MPFNYACTCESVPLTARSHNVNDKNVQAEQNQIHNAYISGIAFVRSVRLRQIHNSEGVYATRRWSRHLRAVALQTTLQPIGASAFTVVYLPKADTSNTSYDTYVGTVNLNGFVQPVCFYH